MGKMLDPTPCDRCRLLYLYALDGSKDAGDDYRVEGREKKEKETDLFYGRLESLLSAIIASFTAFFTAFFTPLFSNPILNPP